MISKKLVGAVAAASLMFSSAVAAAQTAAPEPAQEQALGSDGESEGYGYGAIHIVGGIVIIAGLIYLILTQLDNDEPISP